MGPLLEMADGVLELLRPDLDGGLEHGIKLVALAPGLHVEQLEEAHLLEQLQRADAAVTLQDRLSGLHNPFL